jgi:hypothetical protein
MHVANIQVSQQPEFSQHLCLIVKQFLSAPQDQFAKDGQGHAAAFAIQQSYTECGFKPLDAFGQRRLRNIQGLGRAPEVGMMGHAEQMT